MPDPTPESVACPTCGAGVGDRCGAYGTLYVETHSPRIALSQSRPPNPEWERFADELEKMAFEITHSVFTISNESVRRQHAMIQSAAFESIAAIARRIARGGQ